MRHEVLEQAKCLTTAPDVFDSYTGPNVLLALSLCESCPITTECEAAVRPKRSFYDGVCGGRVWHNGVELKPDVPIHGVRCQGLCGE